MIYLVPYEDSFKTATMRRLSEFFSYHQSLFSPGQSNDHNSNSSDKEIILTLDEWQVPPNALYVIMNTDISVGFIRINLRSPNVAWIEDIFIDAIYRGLGYASSAIKSAESIIMKNPDYTAVCMDVSPRNYSALCLYHKLGYKDLSLITIRKEFGNSKRDIPIQLFDLDYHI